MLNFICLLSCERNNPADADFNSVNKKTVTATDVTGKYHAQIKISAENAEILKLYNDKSFVLSFENPANSVPADEKAVKIVTEVENVIGLEIIEADLPKNAAGMLLSFNNKSNLRTAAARWVTVNLFAKSPKNGLYVYNKSSNTMTVAFAYNKTTSSASGWVNAGTKYLGARQDAEYCKLNVKQLRAAVTYDANSGSYSFFTWQYFSCP